MHANRSHVISVSSLSAPPSQVLPSALHQRPLPLPSPPSSQSSEQQPSQVDPRVPLQCPLPLPSSLPSPSSGELAEPLAAGSPVDCPFPSIPPIISININKESVDNVEAICSSLIALANCNVLIALQECSSWPEFMNCPSMSKWRFLGLGSSRIAVPPRLVPMITDHACTDFMTSVVLGRAAFHSVYLQSMQSGVRLDSIFHDQIAQWRERMSDYHKRGIRCNTSVGDFNIEL